MDHSSPVSWKGYSGRSRAGVEPSRLYDLFGEGPLKGLPQSERTQLVKKKPDKGSHVYVTHLDVGFGEEELFIKTFDTSLWVGVLKDRMLSREGMKRPHHYPIKLAKMLYEESLAKRCWRAAGMCEENNIPVADHLLYLSKGFGWARKEVLVTRGVNPRSAGDARQYFTREFKPPVSYEKARRKEELLKKLGALVRDVHHLNVVFQDFKLHNMVLQEGKEGYTYHLIDLSEVDPGKRGDKEPVFLERFIPSMIKTGAIDNDDLALFIKSYIEAGVSDTRTVEEVMSPVRDRAASMGRKI